MDWRLIGERFAICCAVVFGVAISIMFVLLSASLICQAWINGVCNLTIN